MEGRSPYFVNGAVDALLIGGLSILLFAACYISIASLPCEWKR